MGEAHEAGKGPVSPRQLALDYDRVISAHWRGETEAATTFGTWFEAHWSDQAPPEPDDPPEGTSILGGAGSGIRWYARDEAVIGYVSRRPDGCYRVRMSEAVPSLTDSWDMPEREPGLAAARQPDADHLLHHVGASPVTVQPTRGDRKPAASQWSLQHAVSHGQDPRVLAERDATDSQDEGDRLAGQEPAGMEVLVAGHVLEEPAGGEPSGVPTGH